VLHGLGRQPGLGFTVPVSIAAAVLRQRFIKAFRTDDGRAIVAVFQSRKGVMEAWTAVPTSKMGYVNGQRYGKLIWRRE